MEMALEAGADDLDADDPDYFRVTTAPEDLHTVKEALEERGAVVESAQLDMAPSTTTQLEGKAAQQMLKLMDSFDDHDDIQNLWANFDIADDILANV